MRGTGRRAALHIGSILLEFDGRCAKVERDRHIAHRDSRLFNMGCLWHPEPPILLNVQALRNVQPEDRFRGPGALIGQTAP